MPATARKTRKKFTMPTTQAEAKEFIEDIVREPIKDRQAVLWRFYGSRMGQDILDLAYGPERMSRWVVESSMQMTYKALAEIHYRMTDRPMLEEEEAVFGEVLDAIVRLPVIEVEPLL